MVTQKLIKYQNIIKNEPVLIIGSGRTLKDYHQNIYNFVKKTNPILIGVNYMTDFFVPNFHLWTNKQRYRDLGQCIKKKSIMMFSANMPLDLIRKHHNGPYYRVYYKDSPRYKGKLVINDGFPKGFFRNAGSLAVVISNIMGANSIFMVGIDGYTLYPERRLKQQKNSQHCYGTGFTDDASYSKCLVKDRYIYNSYKTIDKYGIKFKILTPTKYSKFYDSSILGI